MPLRSALFLDFDNVYLSLRDFSEKAAQVFGEAPERWIRWFADGCHDDSGTKNERRILIKRCYLNPNYFRKFRWAYTAAGFKTIDCPPLTGGGKNSADIHMVIDILDILSHHTTFDEFIILSADADFTPVLFRLREHDRQAAIMSTTNAAKALMSSATFPFELDDFAEQALGIGDASSVQDQESASLHPKSRYQGKQEEGANEEEANNVLDFIQARLDASSLAIRASTMGTQINETFGAVIKESKWFGQQTLSGLIRASQRKVLAFWPDEGGLIYDPKRHDPKDYVPASIHELDPDLRNFIKRLRTVGWPLLNPEQFGRIIAATAEGIEQGHVERAPLKKHVRDVLDSAISTDELPDTYQVSSKDLNYLLMGLYREGRKPGENVNSPESIREGLRATAIYMLESRLGGPTEEDLKLLDRLLSDGQVLATPSAGAKDKEVAKTL